MKLNLIFDSTKLLNRSHYNKRNVWKQQSHFYRRRKSHFKHFSRKMYDSDLMDGEKKLHSNQKTI